MILLPREKMEKNIRYFILTKEGREGLKEAKKHFTRMFGGLY